MKKSLFILLATLILGLNASSQSYIKLKDAEVTKAEIETAQIFAHSFLSLNKGGLPYLFKDEAIDVVKTQLTPDNQRIAYAQIKSEFGDFESLAYAETWIDSSNSTYKVFRFKGCFSKSVKKLEIRVVLDKANKISGFWLKPWSDMFN